MPNLEEEIVEISGEEYSSRNNWKDVEPKGNKRGRKETSKQHSKKKRKKEFYKPPTAEELNRLKETENLFNSNLFRLQIEELLAEVAIKQKYVLKLEIWLQNFQSFIGNMPNYGEILLSELKRVERKKMKPMQEFINDIVKMQNANIKCDQDLKLKFVKPESFELLCPYTIQALVGPTLHVSVSLKMPRECFNEKDYLNNRYLVKRYFYLLYLARELNKSELCSEISYKLVKGNLLLPKLSITSKISNKIFVDVYVIPVNDYFRCSRCLPSINNVKAKMLGGFNCKEDEVENYGTPFYNSILLHDFTLNLNEKFSEETLKEFKNVQDAIKLLFVWSKQRELSKDYFGFTNELIIYTLTYLVTKRRINKHTSSYQVSRNFWMFVSNSDWNTAPISICEDIKEDVYEEFKKHFDVTFLDKSGCCNLTAFLDLNMYMKVKFESSLAIKFLDDARFNSFASLFMTKLPFHVQHDSVLRLETSGNTENLINSASTEERCNYIGCTDLLVVKQISKVLRRGLNKRVTQIVPYRNLAIDKWKIGEKVVFVNDLSFGFTFSQEDAFNILELGPHPHDPKVREFLKFWGKLSNLRRFPDGTVCEAVYFETETIKDRRDIVKSILSYLATEKLRLEYEIWFDQFDSVLKTDNLVLPFPTGTNEEATLKVITVSDDLGKILRGLELPLQITAIYGNCDVYCFTDVFPPIPTNNKGGKDTTVAGNNIVFKDSKISKIPLYLPKVDCVIHLSLNSKWPSDLQAIRHVKAAFYLKIAELLESQFGIKANVRPEYLDVFFKGLVFRYKLYHPKEIHHLKEGINSEGLTTYNDTEESLKLNKELNVCPKIYGALRGIQSQYPSYGPSTALIKRWIRSQLIDDFLFSDMSINLLNASLYLNSAPYSPSVLPQVAFVRFLKNLSETDWNLQAAFANFNDEFSKDQLDEIEMQFNQNRQNYPNLCIITPYDDGKSIFTKTSPSKEILRRVVILAKETFNIITSSFTKSIITDVLPLFKANLSGYDVVIYLNKFLNSRSYQNLYEVQAKVELEAYNEKKEAKIPIVHFNPVDLYLQELRHSYGKQAIFFHDSYGGNVIGVLWNSKPTAEREFKVSSIDGHKLNNGKLVLNKEAILEDFHILGKGIVKNIERRNKT